MRLFHAVRSVPLLGHHTDGLQTVPPDLKVRRVTPHQDEGDLLFCRFFQSFRKNR